MTATPKTIQIFLPSGDPRAIRVAEITTRIVRVIEVPRSLLAEFLKMPEAEQVGLYFLVGESEETATPKLYIGQSGGAGGRLSGHNQNKDFWTRALVAVSLTNSLTNTHALFLEWFCIKEAQKVYRYVLENGNAGTRPHTPAPLEADCHEIFDTIRMLVATLGYPVFEPVAKSASEVSAKELFYCKSSGTDAVGEYTSEGFVVLKGSKARKTASESFKLGHRQKQRDALIEAGVLSLQGDHFVFTKDTLFSAPSAAASIVTAHGTNGWVAWKDSEGRTLDEVKRQPSSDKQGS